jgi:microcystin-dependent protein
MTRGMRMTFALAALLIVLALSLVVENRALANTRVTRAKARYRGNERRQRLMRSLSHWRFPISARRTARTAGAMVFVTVASQVSLVWGDNATGTTGSSAPVENRQPTLVLRYMIALQGIPPDDAQSTPTQQVPPNRQTQFIGEIKTVPFNFAPSGWAFCDGQLLVISQNQALYGLIGTAYGGNGVTTFALPDLRGRVPIGAGQGSGLPDYTLGQQVGNANPPLTAANLPLHTHTVTSGNTGATGRGTALDNRQPSLALHFLIAANGEIMIVPWSRQPTGWTRCDGRVLSSATHTFLFNNIGTTYGGNATNFALPDLSGRAVVGDYSDFSWPIGLPAGNNDIVLRVTDIPAHTHTLSSGATGSTGGPGNSSNNYQPSLAMRWVMSFFGFFPIQNSALSFPCVGEIRLIAGATASGISTNNGWSALDGALYSISENETLFNLIGTTYGGDGQETFGTPDLRLRANVSASSGLTIGETLGSATLFINASQLAAHAHLVDLRINSIAHFSDGSATISLAGTVGSSCQVDKSSDFVSWTNLGTVQFTIATKTISDPNSTQAAPLFYRAHP